MFQLKDTLKAFNNLKKQQKSVWTNVFWYIKVCMFWKCIQYNMQWDKTQMLKKYSLRKKKVQKVASFFFC